MLAAVALRGCERGKERERPNAPRPRDWSQKHQAEPPQAAGLDAVALRGANRVAVDALGVDALAAAALDRVINPQHHGAVRRKGSKQEAQQQAGRCVGSPGGPVEHAMVGGEPALPAAPRDPQEAGHRALAGDEDGADQQQLRVPPCSLLPEHRREG